MKHFLPIFQALNSAGIRYLTVGGVAAVIHGVPRMTGDIDIVLDLEDANCGKALKILSELEFTPRAPVKLFDFANSSKRKSWIEEKGMMVFSLYSDRFPLVVVDIFTEPPISYESLSENSLVVQIKDCPIPIASIDDIILMKREAGRDKDLEDIRVLERLRDK